MEDLKQFEGKKRSAGEELVYNEIIGQGKAKGDGGKHKKNEKNKNKRDKKQKQNQILEDNENNFEVKENSQYNKQDTAKSFSTYRDLKSEKFEFYYRVSIAKFTSIIFRINLLPISKTKHNFNYLLKN
jgi:hypothetical protein